jgi:hypothetical protein
VKVGDLVSFQQKVKGLEGFIGVVVELNGPDSVVVQWTPPGLRPYGGGPRPSCELKCFLEVVSESR